MRVRVTSASNGMTASNPTGYYSNGEVEDYPIVIDDVLGIKLISFNATNESNNTVNINWSVSTERNMRPYVIERSDDAINWKILENVTPQNVPDETQNYVTTDASPLNGTSYYRLTITDYSNNIIYSEIKKINIINNKSAIEKIMPNPFQSAVNVKFSLTESDNLYIRLTDVSGKTLLVKRYAATKGENNFTLDNLNNFSKGIYIIELNGKSINSKQILVKQ